MKVSKKSLVIYGLLFYIFIAFFIDDSREIAMILVTALLIITIASTPSLIYQHIKKFILLYVVIAISLVVSLFWGQQSVLYTIYSFECLMIAGILLEQEQYIQLIKNTKYDMFYFILLAGIMIQFMQGYMSGEGRYAISFDIVNDKNYVGILVFLLFIYSNKKKYIHGVILSLIYAVFFSRSRSYTLLLVLFYGIRYFNNRIKKRIIDNTDKTKRRKLMFPIAMIVFISLMVFSYYWVYVVSAHGYSDYRAALNDISNRIRFVANVRSIELLRINLKNLIFGGYGTKLLTELGISEGSSYFLGTRIVQPHNSILNLLLKIGVIPGVIYFYILLSLLEEKMGDKNRIPYIIPYLLNSLFMHSLLNAKWLLLWILIIEIPELDSKIRYRLIIRKKT